MPAHHADLTPPQQEAVRHVDGPLLVLAGAGSGKTRVITHRVAHLIDEGVAPEEILAITFTNKAAGEMQERIANLTGGARVWVSTFHSFCARTLRRYGSWVGLEREFSILDDSDQRVAVREALLETGSDPKLWTPPRVVHAIGRAKDLLRTPDAAREEAADAFEEAVARAYAYYQELLEQSNAVDFSDLLMKTVLLLRQEEVRTILSRKHRYLLIDEYQDTNHAQYQMARLLAQDHRNICATGDPDQSIYGWRGADITNILRFEEDYPEARVIKLEENFRSTRLILDAANGLIRHNTERRDKDLVTAGEEGAPLEFKILNDEYEEARYIARRVQERMLEGVPASEIAIFYRVGSLSRALETAFMERNVRYKVVGSVAFYSRREVKDVLAYLRLVHNPHDNLAMQRVINVPTRGVGKTTLGKLKALARERKTSLFGAIEELSAGKALRGRSREGLRGFLALLGRLRTRAETVTVEELTREVLRETDYRAYVQSISAHTPEELERLENLEALIAGARDFDRRAGLGVALPTEQRDGATTEPRPAAADPEELPLFAATLPAPRPASEADPEPTGIAGFLEHTALVTAAEEEGPGDEKISMMTIHAAKGLEFDSVFVVGIEDGLFPHSRALEDGGGLEEERRLAYVAITRAKRRLVLTRANWRTVQGRSQPQHSSLFLRQVPAEVFLAGESPGERDRDYATYADDDYLGVDPPPWDEADDPPRGKPARRPRAWNRPLSAPASAQTAATELAKTLAQRALGQKERSGAPGSGGTYQVGDRIYHEHFGRGKILGVRGSRHARYAKIDFESYGVKELALHYARMRKLEG